MVERFEGLLCTQYKGRLGRVGRLCSSIDLRG